MRRNKRDCHRRSASSAAPAARVCSAAYSASRAASRAASSAAAPAARAASSAASSASPAAVHAAHPAVHAARAAVHAARAAVSMASGDASSGNPRNSDASSPADSIASAEWTRAARSAHNRANSRSTSVASTYRVNVRRREHTHLFTGSPCGRHTPDPRTLANHGPGVNHSASSGSTLRW